MAAALLPLYKFSDGFEMVLRRGHLQLHPIAEFEHKSEFLVIGTDIYGADLVVDLATEGHPVFWHCTFKRPIAFEEGELLVPTVAELLSWLLQAPL